MFPIVLAQEPRAAVDLEVDRANEAARAGKLDKKKGAISVSLARAVDVTPEATATLSEVVEVSNKTSRREKRDRRRMEASRFRANEKKQEAQNESVKLLASIEEWTFQEMVLHRAGAM